MYVLLGGSEIRQRVIVSSDPEQPSSALVSHSRPSGPATLTKICALRATLLKETFRSFIAGLLPSLSSDQIEVCAILANRRRSSDKLLQRTTEVAAAIKRSLPDKHNKE